MMSAFFLSRALSSCADLVVQIGRERRLRLVDVVGDWLLSLAVGRRTSA